MDEKQYEYTAEAKDQGAALDEACEYALKKGLPLLSIIWKGEIDGKHVFIVTIR
jgi:hypothetical protein